MPFTLTTPLPATADIPTAVSITAGRLRRITIEIPLNGAATGYRIFVDWVAGQIISGVFTVYKTGSENLLGTDATEVLTVAASTGNAGRQLERAIWLKLIALGKIPAGTVT